MLSRLTGDPGRTLGECLSRWAAELPAEPAHTFVDYRAEPGGVRHSCSWAELDRWTRATATLLAGPVAPGERVAIVAPSGPEYVVALLAALRAGMVAVPLFPPELPGHADRLAAALRDCSPAALVAPADRRDGVIAFLAERGLPRPALVCPEDVAGPAGEVSAADYRDPGVAPGDVAYLQYTSGSTRTPAGVEVTHRNIVANARQVLGPHGISRTGVTAVSWLPLYHDMGLMLAAAAPVVVGAPSVLMDPLAFLFHPIRWLRELAARPGAFTAAPNFAYDLTARRVSPAEREGLDLSGVAAMVNGAEPILPATLERFQQAFGPCGLDPAVVSPSYGLAEATVLVCTTPSGCPPRRVSADTAALQAGRLVPAGDPDAGAGTVTTLVASGMPAGQQVAIVDPVTSRACGPGVVGEIWVHGDNVARGYWNQPEASRRTFGALLAEGGAPGPHPAGPWLRSGDLGVMHEGYLVVTGRMKDLIVIDGRNLYPQDLEVTVQEADPAVALHRLAAFPVALPGGEGVVVVAEQYRRIDDAGQRLAQIERAVREAVAARHAVAVHDVVLVRPDTIPRTSSGKIARAATRAAYLEGRLERVAPAGGLS